MVLIVGASVGLLIALIDSRPGWDDTGVTAGAIALSACLLALASTSPPWMIALAVGLWVPAYALATTGNWGALLALVFAVGGAYLGAAFRRSVLAPSH